MKVAPHFSAGFSFGMTRESVKRTAEIVTEIRIVFSRPFHGLFNLALAIPALKCWAIVCRPAARDSYELLSRTVECSRYPS